ncbi:MAG: hypothetical protein ABWX92_02815 [Mycetocola sp.]
MQTPFRINRCTVTSLFWFAAGAAIAAPPIVEMGSRDAPATAARPSVKSYTVKDIADAPKFVLARLAAPGTRELFARKLSTADSLSFGREPSELGVDGRVHVPAGIDAIRVEVTSPTAMHLRTAWRFADDADYSVTVFAGNDLGKPLTSSTGSSMNGDARLIWSGITSGDAQEVLIRRLRSDREPWLVSLERVAHFDRSIHPGSPEIVPKGLGDSSPCQQDMACLFDFLSNADQAIVLSASRAVAYMLLTNASGNTGICTGTLLNSASYPRPVFITANHCIQDAVTLDTLWFFARTACGLGTYNPAAQVTGGAKFLFASRALDSALLALSEMPPAQASYAGWNANPAIQDTLMLALHHPKGDVMKASLGNVTGTNPFPTQIGTDTFAPGSMYTVDWQLGFVEVGSSGSAFFTFDTVGNNTMMRVRGTLTGGRTSCSGGPSRTFYQRLDLIYPYIAAQLTTPLENPIVEYVNTANFPKDPGGHFFYTNNVGEIQFVDSGGAGQFVRTGKQFNAGGSKQLCRFYGSVSPGPNSHFFSISDNDCQYLRSLQVTPTPTTAQQWNYEGLAFSETPAITNSSGVPVSCPSGMLPVYRYYNNAYHNGVKNPWDSNHRYGTDKSSLDAFAATNGWAAEGIAFCALR